MERCPTQAVLPLVGLAAEKVIRDRYSSQDVRRPVCLPLRQLSHDRSCHETQGERQSAIARRECKRIAMKPRWLVNNRRRHDCPESPLSL
ncbi:MAG: hypothetical protein ACQESR_16690 [Planctomycetota bacterium]